MASLYVFELKSHRSSVICPARLDSEVLPTVDTLWHRAYEHNERTAWHGDSDVGITRMW